jgi:hypothetical protein
MVAGRSAGRTEIARWLAGWLYLRAGVDEVDVGHPLDHAAADVARDDDTHGEAVVRRQQLAVVHVRHHDVLRVVQLQGRRRKKQARRGAG